MGGVSRFPNMPSRIQGLPRDSRGFPVPWFVAWFKGPDKMHETIPGAGEPDFRVIAAGKLARAYHAKLCWICGQPLGSFKVFVIGPMCVVNRVTSEPPSHRDCATFAAEACPFLTKPRMRRNDKGIEEMGGLSRGLHIDRNPGATALYQTNDYRPFKAGKESWNVLFQLGPPDRVDWFAEGKTATREQVLASIDSGFPLLMETAVKHDGPEGVKELLKMRDAAMIHLPQALQEA